MTSSPLGNVSEHIWLTILVIACVLVTIAWTGIEPQLAPDSSGYLSFSTSRSLGYPLYLALFNTSLGEENLELVVMGHWLLFLGASLVLANALHQVVGPYGAFFTILLITANPFLIEYHQKILTESLFISLCMIVMALVISLMQSATIWKLTAYAIVCCLAYWLRPVALALPALLILLLPLLWPQLKERLLKCGLALIIPAFIFVGIDTVSQQLIHGDQPRQSLLVNHAFGKAALVPNAEFPQYEANDPRRNLEDILEHGFSDVRGIIRSAPNTPIAIFLSSNYEVFAQYQLGQQPEYRFPAISNLRVLQLEVSLSRLWQNPGSYLRLVWLNFKGCWTVTTVGDFFFDEDIRSYLDRIDDIPFSHALPEPKAPSLFAATMTLSIWLMGIFTTFVVPIAYFAFPKHRTLQVNLIFLFSALINGYFLLVALTGIGIPRYALAVLPVMVVVAMLTVQEFVRRLPLVRLNR